MAIDANHLRQTSAIQHLSEVRSAIGQKVEILAKERGFNNLQSNQACPHHEMNMPDWLQPQSTMRLVLFPSASALLLSLQMQY
jgi:hypothetical protein